MSHQSVRILLEKVRTFFTENPDCAQVSAGTLLIMDRGYVDFKWMWELTQQGVHFVTRMKKQCVHKVRECRKTNRTHAYLLLMLIKFQSKLGWGMPAIMAALTVMLFSNLDLARLWQDVPKERHDKSGLIQIPLFQI